MDRRGSEEMFRALFDSAPDALVVVDSNGQIVFVNAQVEKLFDYRGEELLGQQVELLVPEHSRERHSGHRCVYSTDPHTRMMGPELQLIGRRKDGSEFAAEISLSPLATDRGAMVSTAVRDVTHRRDTEQAAAHFTALVESSHDAIIGKGLDGVVTSWNAGAEKLYGYTSADIVGKSISLLVPPDRHDEVPAILRRVSRGELIREFETVRARKDGTRVDVSLTVSPIRSRDGTVVGASTVARDISDRLRYQNQLMFLAQHDAMTGAHNRLSFEREVGDQVVRARRYGESAVVAIIDLDNFKHINDTYGHASGDQALKAVASILHQRLRQTDFVARIGGDEFAIILPYASADQGVAVTADVQRLINECNVEASHDPVLCLSASVGLAHIDKDAVSAEAILIEADAAMYADKRRTAA